MSKFRQGELVICVDNDGHEHSLTRLKEYPVIRTYPNWCQNQIIIHNDRGVTSNYNESRFEIAGKKIKTMETNKKLVGYNLKRTLSSDIKKAALTIADVREFCKPENGRDYQFGATSIVADDLRRAGVLDLWFDEVYEQHDTQNYTVRYDGNKTTLVTISKHGIFVKDENILLDIKAITDAYMAKRCTRGGIKHYDIIPTMFNIGCYHNIPASEIEMCLRVYNKITTNTMDDE